MKTIKRRLNQSNILNECGNQATMMVLAALCEDSLPYECYRVSNRYDRHNCGVRLFSAGSEIFHDDCQEIDSVNIFLLVQSAINWDDKAVISVQVWDDSLQSEIDEAWKGAAMDYIYSRGIRADAYASVRQALRKACGIFD